MSPLFSGAYFISHHPKGRSQQQPPSHGQQQQAMANGHGPSLTNGSVPASLTTGPIPAQPFPPTSQTPVSFTAEQIGALHAQIYTFKLITRGQPIPEHVQQAIRVLIMPLLTSRKCFMVPIFLHE